MRVVNLYLFLIFLLTACASTEVKQQTQSKTPSKALSDAEVTQLISGKTIFATSSRGNSYKSYFAADGSLKNSAGETGKWKIKNGSICNTYISRGFAGCDKVYRTAKNTFYYVVPSGKRGTINKILAGNKL